MSNVRNRFGMLCAVLLFTLSLLAADAPKSEVYDNPEKVDKDYAYQGEYVGVLGDDKLKYGIQVIALGDGKFHAVGYPGGLPGDGWTFPVKVEAEGEVKSGFLEFGTKEGKAVFDGEGGAKIYDGDGDSVGEVKKVKRESPTLGAKPPEGATVLFDGTNPDNFDGGQMTEDKLLKEGANSKHKHGSCQLHLEFRLPYMPKARGQGRGNSGCYLQSRYEVQILDSFGLEGKNNEAGGIYTIKDPAVNMCFPPLTWQTYDIDYTAAKFDDKGKKIENARMTVKHNGVVVQDKTELDHATTAAPLKEGPEPGPLHLQNHGNPVRFRNIWIVAK